MAGACYLFLSFLMAKALVVEKVMTMALNDEIFELVFGGLVWSFFAVMLVLLQQ